MKVHLVLLALLLFLGYSLAISSAGLQQCKDMFTSDREYMKQKYLEEHPKLSETDVNCDCWGCHNTSSCCWSNGYWWGDGQWWWVWIIGFCLLVCFFFLIGGLLVVSTPWVGGGYGYGFSPLGSNSQSVKQKVTVELEEGAHYHVRGGQLRKIKEK